MYALVLAFFISGYGIGENSNALTVVDGFDSAASCEAAGKAAQLKFTSTVRTASYVCVRKP